jgi:hypothetical protein
MTTYVNPFTGQTTSPTPSSYSYIDLIESGGVYTVQLQWPINGVPTTSGQGIDVINNFVLSNINDINPITGDGVILPSAQQVSVGQAFTMRNIGGVDVGVYSFGEEGSPGSLIAVLSPGITKYFYLTDNTTGAGVWASFTLGAGVALVDATSLVSPDHFYGIRVAATYPSAILGQEYPTVYYYSDNVIPSYSGLASFCIYNGGVGTLSLPDTEGADAGWFCMVRNNGTGILTLAPNGSQTIDETGSLQLQLGESVTVVSDGTNWATFGIGRSNSFVYTQLFLSVTGGTRTLSSVEAANTMQVYSGALASQQTIIVPSTVQLYAITNNTTGAQSFIVRTAVGGGGSVTIAQSTSVIVTCDGTNVYNAASGSASTLNSITLGNGSTASPSLKFSGDATTGLYLPASGQLGFVVSNTLAGYFSSTGLTVTNGISGGTF